MHNELHLLNNKQFLNVFFSLHAGETDPFYVSEVVLKSINFDFQEFSFRNLNVAKRQSFTMKIWFSDSVNSCDWKKLVELEINLKNLLYVNQHLDDVDTDVKNCFLFSLFDGVYYVPLVPHGDSGSDAGTGAGTGVFGVPEYLAQLSQIDESETAPSFRVESFSYDLMMKLNNIQLVVEDLVRTKKALSREIEENLKDSINKNDLKIKSLMEMISVQGSRNAKLKSKLESLTTLKSNKLSSFNNLKTTHSETNLSNLKDSFAELIIKNETVIQELVILRSKITLNLISIFPKEQITEWLDIKEKFDYLPTDINLSELLTSNNANSNASNSSIEQINAGFGYLVHIVYLLSRYLAIPLRYEVKPFGSTSYIIDKISNINQRKIFPLFNTVHYYRFQYGAMLLNRNIKDILKELYNF